MPQINLLKEKRSNPRALQPLIIGINFLLMAVVLGLIAYYGWMYFTVKSNTKNTVELQANIGKEKNAALKSPDRQQLLARQAQLKELEGIVAKHSYWSALLPSLAKVTLKEAQFMTVKIDTANLLNISVSVPNTESLDKFLQVFDLPEYNKNFYNLKIGSISNGQKEDKLLTKFDVRMNYNPELLKYSAVKNGFQ